MTKIRNFAIIAHVDHGKSTLADRFLEITGVVKAGQHEEQMLDKNPISRERGITIKLAPVRMEYKGYILNLIDTPGHVDFSYEVERTLACVEGVILLVDATQSIQAQTIAHAYKALEQNLTIIPAVNKIDMPHAAVKKTKSELGEFLGVPEREIFEISAKTGQNVNDILLAVIAQLPSPAENIRRVQSYSTRRMEEGGDQIQALIFDSYYDPYRGVIAFVRIFSGSIKKNDKIKLIATNQEFVADEVGYFTPDLKSQDKLSSGEIGYVVTKLKDIHWVRIGDTMTTLADSLPLAGYRPTKPMVFASVFPTDADDFVKLKEALEKLTLNDASLTYSGIYSQALGSGFRVGFLGLLHADVVRERLEREFDLSIILTPPTVEYEIVSQGKFREPIADVTIVTPQEYVGSVMRLCEESRGTFKTMDNKSQVFLQYEIPLSEIVTIFFDRLKTITSGYASFDWSFKKYQDCDAGRLSILLNGDPVEEFSEYVVTERAYSRGSLITRRLKELIPRQQYEVKIQAQFKGKIIASTRIAPFRKDVTAKLYGGDRTRKDKLLKKQKKGKKDMKNVGSVEIPKGVFLKLFKS